MVIYKAEIGRLDAQEHARLERIEANRVLPTIEAKGDPISNIPNRVTPALQSSADKKTTPLKEGGQRSPPEPIRQELLMEGELQVPMTNNAEEVKVPESRCSADFESENEQFERH